MQKIPVKPPNLPGVYFFLDINKRPIYIGKAASLTKRIASYFRKPKDTRINRMVSEAKELRWSVAYSEIESLILESQLIKKYQPKYNILLRDDKRYFYVVLTKEKFPKVYLTHQPDLFDTQITIGPFANGNMLKMILKNIRKIIPYCSCRRNHERTCLNGHIGRCSGFCCSGNPSSQEVKDYRKNILMLKNTLNGRKNHILRRIQNNNNDQSLNKTRKQIIKSFSENTDFIKKKNNDSQLSKKMAKIFGLRQTIHRIECYDTSHISGKEATGAMIVFESGVPIKADYRKFRIKYAPSNNDIAMLSEILERRFNHPEWPLADLIIVDGGKGQYNATVSTLQKRNITIPVLALTKDSRHKGKSIYAGNFGTFELKQLPKEIGNLILFIDSEAHRFAIGYHRLLHRKVVKK